MADRAGLPFGDTADFEAADRGLVDVGDPVVRNEAGEVVWDNGSYRSFLTGDAPDTVHPSLWRQSTLVARQGLFEVTDGIYQVRGYDLSNLSVIEVVAKARRSFAAGDLRWAAEVLDHVVFADPGHAEAKALLADVFDQLAYGAENGTWRCEFLSAAKELRTGNFGTPAVSGSVDIVSQLSPEMLFDAVAIQVNGPAAWDLDLAIRWDLPDRGASYRTTLRNGVLTYVKDSDKPVGLTLTVPTAALLPLALGNLEAARRNGLTTDGDENQLASLFGVLQPGNPNFNIIEP